MAPPIAPATPLATIRVDGQVVPSVSASLLALSVEARVDRPACCELTLANWGPQEDGSAGYLWFNGDVLDLGRHLTVTVDADPRGGEVFRGVITGLRAHYDTAGPPRLVVVAHDRLLALQQTRRSRTFEHATDAEVIAAVAADHGLPAEVDASGPTHRVVAQTNTSDLTFLQERARYLDADVLLDGDTLLVRARANRPPIAPTWHYGADLLGLEVAADLAGQATAVRVGGYDRASKEAIDEVAPGSVLAPELDPGQQSGPGLQSAVLGDRIERVGHLAPDDVSAARALATEALRSRARRFVRATALIDGDARARPGWRGALAGLGPRFSGRYGIVGVRHTFDSANGFRSTLDLERPGLGGPS
jgi:uncharacterized protein